MRTRTANSLFHLPGANQPLTLPHPIDSDQLNFLSAKQQSMVSKASSHYNLLWDSPSSNSSGSMPLGGYDVGLNLWCEGDSLLFYIGKQDSFDENNQVLKLGRIRINFQSFAFNDCKLFRQELLLNEGAIKIACEKKDGSALEGRIWIEHTRPVIHIETNSTIPIKTSITFETWRFEDRLMKRDNKPGNRFAVFSLIGYPGDVVTRKDTAAFVDQGVMAYHRNDNINMEDEILIRYQDLENIRDTIPRILHNRTFGALIRFAGSVQSGTVNGIYSNIPYQGWKVESGTSTEKEHIKLAVLTSQAASIEQWKHEVHRLVTEDGISYEKNAQYWDKKFSDHYIIINKDSENKEDDIPWTLSRNYSYFRFMMLANEKGEYPSRFNGGMFTFDPQYVVWNTHFTFPKENPDYRTWGNLYTGHNQRLAYWALLRSGDFDAMISQFEFFRRTLPAAEARTREYWGHDGCSYTEQLTNLGLPGGAVYGFFDGYSRTRSPDTARGDQENITVRYLFAHQLDFAFMMLEYHRFSGKSIDKYMPFIISCVKFYIEHYQYRLKKSTGKPLDKNGKIVIAPSTSLENVKDAVNPAEAVAGLHAVVDRVLDFPDNAADAETKSLFREYKKKLPDLPTKQLKGESVFAIAESHKSASDNMDREVTHFYAAFPFDRCPADSNEHLTARKTWMLEFNKDYERKYVCFHQEPIMAARLGFVEDAEEFVKLKLGTDCYRFPGFWSAGCDWAPDHNRGGSAMCALQEMLVQTVDNRIILFPAWPAEWDVAFRMSAPFGATIECEYKNGEIMELKVTPPSRKEDVSLYRDISK